MGDSSQSRVTPYLIYLVFVTTLGPLQFGYHLVRLEPPKVSTLTDTHRPSLMPLKQSLRVKRNPSIRLHPMAYRNASL